MNKQSMDEVDRVLSSLAMDDSLELPDSRLQGKLMRAAERKVRRPATGFLGTRLRLLAASIALMLGLTSVAVGATVGLEGLKAWWYSIVIDGEELRGSTEGEGTQRVEYTTPDGVRVSVSIGRQDLPGAGALTEILVVEDDGASIEEEIHAVRRGPAAQLVERFARRELAGAQALHTWVDTDGTRKSLCLDRDPEGPGSRLLVDELDSLEDLPVTLVLRTARPISTGGVVSITKLEDGAIEVDIDDGHGWGIAVTLGGPAGASDPPSEEFTTPSGRVRVNVGD